LAAPSFFCSRLKAFPRLISAPFRFILLIKIDIIYLCKGALWIVTKSGTWHHATAAMSHAREKACVAIALHTTSKCASFRPAVSRMMPKELMTDPSAISSDWLMRVAFDY